MMIDSKIFSDKVQESFKWLIDLGFQFKLKDRSIKFELVNKNEAFALGFSWSEYNEILVNGIVAYKRFNSLESVMQEVTGGDLDYTIKHHWFGDIPEELEKIKDQNHFNNAFFIANISEVEILSSIVKGFYNTEAKVFFEKYPKLDDVVIEMDKLPSDKKASMIVNTSNSTFIRIMAIKYFIEPKDGEEFFNETVKELSPLKSQRVFGDILQKMDRLKSMLA